MVLVQMKILNPVLWHCTSSDSISLKAISQQIACVWEMMVYIIFERVSHQQYYVMESSNTATHITNNIVANLPRLIIGVPIIFLRTRRYT